MLLPEYRKVTYDDADFARLSETFQIPDTLRAELRQRLEDAAAIWRWHRGDGKRGIPPSQTRKELQDLARRGRSLRNALAALSPAATEVLRRAEGQRCAQAISDGNAGTGYPMLTGPDATSALDGLVLDAADLCHILAGFESAVDEAAETLRMQIAGRKRDHALRMWMANIEMTWRDFLGRRFSRDVTNAGEPITEAARFCVAAFARLDPTTPQSLVLNEMKQRIKRRN